MPSDQCKVQNDVCGCFDLHFALSALHFVFGSRARMRFMDRSSQYSPSIVIYGVCAFCFTCPSFLRADDIKPGAADSSTEAASSRAEQDGTKYLLRYKCAIGDVWRYEVSHRASIRSTIDQTTQAAQTRTDSVKSWKITDVLADGSIEFMTVVEKVRMVNQLPDTKPTEYDSERDTTPPPGYEDAARSVGVPLSIVRMTPYGKVVRRDAKIRRASGDDDGPLTVLLPEQPVTVGDAWDEPFNLTVVLKTGGTKAVQTAPALQTGRRGKRRRDDIDCLPGIDARRSTNRISARATLDGWRSSVRHRRRPRRQPKDGCR